MQSMVPSSQRISREPSLKGTYYAKKCIRCLNTVVWPQCVKTTSL